MTAQWKATPSSSRRSVKNQQTVLPARRSEYNNAQCANDEDLNETVFDPGGPYVRFRCPSVRDTSRVGVVLALAGLALVTAALAPAGETTRTAPAVKVFKSLQSIDSGKKPIQAEWFKPQGTGPHPAILLVHEAAGMTPLPARIFREYSELLAGKGYIVLLVHYFNRTGHERVDPRKPDEIRKHFPAWRETIRDSLKHLASQPDVDPRRVGLLGISLGSFLSLSVAMDRELGVAAVASLFGGLPDELWQDLRYLPPVLVIGGKQDQLVSANKCYAIRGWCAEKGVDCECCVFENQGHLFEEDVKKYLFAAPVFSKDMREAQSRVLAFFARCLHPDKKASPGKRIDRLSKPSGP
jgi:carboxymethylenebutenolidase